MKSLREDIIGKYLTSIMWVYVTSSWKWSSVILVKVLILLTFKSMSVTSVIIQEKHMFKATLYMNTLKYQLILTGKILLSQVYYLIMRQYKTSVYCTPAPDNRNAVSRSICRKISRSAFLLHLGRRGTLKCNLARFEQPTTSPLLDMGCICPFFLPSFSGKFYYEIFT